MLTLVVITERALFHITGCDFKLIKDARGWAVSTILSPQWGRKKLSSAPGILGIFFLKYEDAPMDNFWESDPTNFNLYCSVSY